MCSVTQHWGFDEQWFCMVSEVVGNLPGRPGGMSLWQWGVVKGGGC